MRDFNPKPTTRKCGTAIFLLDHTRTRIWMHRRVATRDFNGCMGLPGGAAEPGETPSETAARELRQETGIRREPHQLAFLKRTAEDKSPTDLWCTFWFSVLLGPEEKPQNTEEIADHWESYALRDIPTGEKLFPGITEMIPLLHDYLESLPPTNIAAAYRCALSTVDMAVVRYRGGTYEVLLGRKKHAAAWRIPGGFVDPDNDSDFEDAVDRERVEEVPGCKVQPGKEIVVLGLKVNDPRYSRDKDKLFTTLFLKQYDGPEDWQPKGGDDLPEVGWYALENQVSLAPAQRSPLLDQSSLVEEHIPLIQKLRLHLKSKTAT
jgi:ADP-ribose pyrophosphatase YjhB (NUDIX family)